MKAQLIVKFEIENEADFKKLNELIFNSMADNVVMSDCGCKVTAISREDEFQRLEDLERALNPEAVEYVDDSNLLYDVREVLSKQY